MIVSVELRGHIVPQDSSWHIGVIGRWERDVGPVDVYGNQVSILINQPWPIAVRIRLMGPIANASPKPILPTCDRVDIRNTPSRQEPSIRTAHIG
ncbi:MAG: hypothetical protein K6T83_19675 [Alicyclobacillus sp.]|nr:hypothetical protein [Alicyclobacillus sp.]